MTVLHIYKRLGWIRMRLGMWIPQDLLPSLLCVIDSLIKSHFFLHLHFHQGKCHNNYENVLWNTETCMFFFCILSSCSELKTVSNSLWTLGNVGSFSLVSPMPKVSLNLSRRTPLLSVHDNHTTTPSAFSYHTVPVKHRLHKSHFWFNFIHPEMLTGYNFNLQVQQFC